MKKILLLIIFIAAYSSAKSQSIHIISYDTTGFPNAKAQYFAFDEDSGLLDDLGVNDFEIEDNGSPVDINQVRNPNQVKIEQLSLLITFDLALNGPDNGDSNFSSAVAMTKSLIELLEGTGSEAALTSFDDKSYLHSDFTTDLQYLADIPDNFIPAAGSDFNAGLLSEPIGALPVVQTGQYNKTILLVTDSRGSVDKDKLIDIAEQQSVRIFCAGYMSRISDEIKEICTKSGGSYIENISPEDNPAEIAALVHAYLQNLKPSEISFKLILNCDNNKNVSLFLQNPNVSDSFQFGVDESQKPHLDNEPAYLRFSSILPPEIKEGTVTITARNKDIQIDSMTLGDPHFTFVSGQVEKFLLRENESHDVTVRFTPTDSAIVFTRLMIHSDACRGTDVLLTGGFPNTPPNNPTMKILKPDSGDVFIIGETEEVEWEGVLPKDVIQLEYSIDAGRNWDTLAKDITGLRYNWNIPDEESDSCLIRALQLWPNNVGRTMNLIHENAVNAALFNRESDLIITAGKDSTARIWNSNNGDELLVLEYHTQPLTWVNFSPDSKKAVTAAKDSTAAIWNAQTGELLHVLKGHDNIVYSCEFSPDGREVMTSGFGGEVIFWDAETGEKINQVETGNLTLFASYSPNGDYFLTSGISPEVKMWSTVTDEVIKKFDTEKSYEQIGNAFFSPDGSKIAASSKIQGAYVWDVLSGSLLSHVEHKDSTGYSAPIMHVSFDPTSDTLLTSGFENKINMWEANTGEHILTFLEHTKTVNSAVFNFDASRVLSASWDFTAKIWNRDQRDLQSDTSDAYFRIARARILAHDIDFGEVILGNISDQKIDTFIVNLNDFPFRIEDIEITGPDKDDFTILSGFAPYEIQGDALKGIEIRFAPSQTGSRTAAIRITIPDVLFEASLTGKGIEPGIYTVADNINFGGVELGEYRDSTVSFIIENKTLVPVIVDSVYISGPDTEHFDIISGGGSYQLQSGEGREMTLRYTPESFDRISSILKFEIASYTDDVSITMFGRGIPETVDTIEIRIPDITGAPGEIVDLPVYIEKVSTSGKYSSVDSYIAELRFNSTLLEPLGPADVVKKDVVGYPERKIELELPADFDDDGTMTVLQFRVGLGNKMTTSLNLENIYPANNAKILIKEASSVFSLEDNCLDGGPRLIDTEGTLRLSQNSPNPGITKTVIDFEVIESGYTELYVVDFFGTKVLELAANHLLPGKYSVTANLSELSAGVYYYILKTPSNMISRRMDVIK